MIIVGVPSYNELCPQFVKSLPAAIKCDQITRIMYKHNLNICTARNEIAKAAVDLGASHVFFMDVDMVFPAGTLAKLIDSDKDVIGGYYHRTCTGFSPNAFVEEKRGFTSKWFSADAGITRVAGLGTGCMLIKTKVIAGLKFPWFNYEPNEADKRLMTEDIVFGNHVIEAGFELWLDPSIRCGHVGNFIVTPLDDKPTVKIQSVR